MGKEPSPANASSEEKGNQSLPETTSQFSGPEQPGAMIGRYKLRELIGEGGMGTVWIAEQTEPVRRKVALKLVKAGMDTKEVLSRFQVERQALALMDHPNIAKVHDGGVTASGRPFFVMEYVKGIPITTYCDEAKLPLKQRLELFVDVCQAVQHAHQKGIIHRDLKPSNVLVCLYDGRPVPKIIDFGLAKAMHQPLTENTLYTAHGLMVGTPQYMSPEQAEFNNLDVDTRTDVYSLGVILYELLTGTTPLERKRIKEAAAHEVLRLIKEEDPQRPSTKISSSGSLPTVAAQRSLEPGQLSRLVKGDLDWIAMKALEKDRGRRYETANGLARDVQRYLADEPVEACPPSMAYKLRKLARRYKSALVMTALLSIVVLGALSVVAGSVGYVVRDRLNRQAHLERQTKNALEELQRAVEENRLAEAEVAWKKAEGFLASSESASTLDAEVKRWQADLKMVQRLRDIHLDDTADPTDSSGSAATFAAYRQAFDDYGASIDKDAPATAAARIRESSIRKYLLAAIDDWIQNLEVGLASGRQTNESERLRTIATLVDDDLWRIKLRAASLAKDVSQLKQLAEDDQWQGQLPLTTAVLAMTLLDCGDYDSAYRLLDRTLERHPNDFDAHLGLGLMSKLADPFKSVRHLQFCRDQRPRNAGIRTALSQAHYECDELTPAIDEAREAIRLRGDYAAAYAALGLALAWIHDEGSVPAYRAAVGLEPTLGDACYALADALIGQNKLAEAEKVFRAAIEKGPQSAPANTCLGDVLRQQEKWPEAERAYRDAKLYGADLRTIQGLAEALARQKKFSEAEDAYQEGIRLLPKEVELRAQFADFLQSQSRWPEAETQLEAGLQIEPQNSKLLAVKTQHANLLARRVIDNLHKDPEQAAADLLRAVETPEKLLSSDRNACLENAKLWFNVGQALLERHSSKFDPDAEKAFRRAVATLEQWQVQESNAHDQEFLEWIAVANVWLGDSLWMASRTEESQRCYDRAMRLDSKSAVNNHFPLARDCLSKGDWNRAAHHLAFVVDSRPEDHLLAMQAAVLQLYRGDREGYERICHRMLEMYGETKDPTLADRTAKACLLANPPCGDLSQLRRLADVAMSNPKHDYYRVLSARLREEFWRSC